MPDDNVSRMDWCTAEMECVICGYEWVAVEPGVAARMEREESGNANRAAWDCTYDPASPPVRALPEALRKRD